MKEVIARAEIEIRRPIDIVRRQFSDLPHHLEKRVHPDIELVVLASSPGKAEFIQGVRVMGRMRRNRVRLETTPDGDVLASFIEGPDAGTVQAVKFEVVGADATFVRSSLVIPVSGAQALLAPLVRWYATAGLAKSLGEDRKDLEESGYMTATT